jgi:RimJ/RimL family protein N-acetyltransferase
MRGKDLLEGKLVNLRTAEKDDASLIARWWSDQKYLGEYQDPIKVPKDRIEKNLLEGKTFFFIIEKKNGSKIGHVTGGKRGRSIEIGFALVPNERGKGYGKEAIQIMVDYLFLSKDIVRIQSSTDTRNLASHKVLEKVGFIKEGTMRKTHYAKGEYKDLFLYSILREEWKEPKILTK